MSLQLLTVISNLLLIEVSLLFEVFEGLNKIDIL